MRQFEFRGKGFKTLANAKSRLDTVGTLITQWSGKSTGYVAVQGDKFYPVIVLSADDIWLARYLIDQGIYVTN